MADPEREVEQQPLPPEQAPPGMPTWVKALLIVLAVVIVAILVTHLTGHAPTHMSH